MFVKRNGCKLGQSPELLYGKYEWANIPLAEDSRIFGGTIRKSLVIFRHRFGGVIKYPKTVRVWGAVEHTFEVSRYTSE